MLIGRGRSPPELYPCTRNASALCNDVRKYFRTSADTSHESKRPWLRSLTSPPVKL